MAETIYDVAQPNINAAPNNAAAPTNNAAPSGNPANVLSEAGKDWMENKANGSYGEVQNNSGVYDNPYAQKTEANDQYGRKYGTGNYTVWGDGTVTVNDGYQNLMGRFDSAGNWHPALSGENQQLADTWADSAKQAIIDAGHQFNGDGSEWANYENQNSGYGAIDWDSMSDAERRAKIKELGLTGEGPWTRTSDFNTELQNWVRQKYGPDTIIVDDDALKSGAVNLEPGKNYVTMSQILTQWYQEDAANTNLQHAIKGGGPNADGTYSPLVSNDYLVPRGSVTGGGGYGTGGGGGDTPLIGGGVDPGIQGQLWDLVEQLKDLPQNSPAYAEAMEKYRALTAQHPELVIPEAERTVTDYDPTDYTTQIEEIYDKNRTAATQRIRDQLAIGELDIDRAIEKLPEIYEAGMNDLSTQYEINKRNANEYFNANGLSSGARAQAALAMNNVYQANMSAYRMEQANAIKEYEEKRVDLRLQAQASITEALLQNDADRASALLQEYQRQDQQAFQFLLQKMDDDYRYYALAVDTAIKKASFEEEQRQTDMSAYLKEAEMEQSQTQFQQQYMLNITKLQTEIVTAQQELNLKKAELAEKQREFNLELKENGRQFDATLDLKIKQLQADIAAQEAELQYKLSTLDEEKRQFDIKIEEEQRQFNTKYGTTGKTKKQLDEASAKLLNDMIYKINVAGYNQTNPDFDANSIDPADVASTLITSFLNNPAMEGWTEDDVWYWLNNKLDTKNWAQNNNWQRPKVAGSK